MSLTLVFWLTFAGTILMATMGWSRSEAKTMIVLVLVGSAVVGLIA